MFQHVPCSSQSWGGDIHFQWPFLWCERASRVYLGILGNRILVSEWGRLLTVFVRQQTRGKAASMCAPPETESTVGFPCEHSGLSLWAGSGEHWPHFHAVLILCNYTYPWSFSFSPFIFFKTSVLIFSSIFHVSPYSLSFCFFFSYLLEIASIPCLVSLFCFGR